MMDTATWRQRLIEEGFTRVFAHTDAPGTVYDEHSHPTDHVQIILDGAIEIIIGDERRIYQPQERCDLAAGTPHAAIVGAEGCSYLVGER
jgi:quercetin dioxygenase-like cupin family protein